MMPFFCIHISQGSVATCLKRGGIFKHEFVANLLQSRLVKKSENPIIISEVMAKSLVSCFLTHGVYCTLVDRNAVTPFYFDLLRICCTPCSYSCVAVDKISTD